MCDGATPNTRCGGRSRAATAGRCRLQTIEKAQGAHECLLDDVFGIGRIATQPARKVVGRIEVRQGQRLETANLLAVVALARGLSIAAGHPGSFALTDAPSATRRV